MNVLYISSWSLQSANFLAEESYCLPKLAEEGLRFILITSEQYPFALSEIAKKQKKETLKRKGIIWKPLNYHQNNFISILISVWAIFLGIYLVKKYAITVIFTRSSVPGVVGGVIKLFFRRLKFIHRNDSSLAEEYIDSGYWKGTSLIARGLSWAEKIYMNNADIIIVLTEKLRRRYERESTPLLKRTILLPCCIDTQEFVFDIVKRERLRKRCQLEDKRVYIYCGKWGSSYCIKEMLEFFSEALRSDKNFFLVILTPSPREPFLQLISKMGINSDSAVYRGDREDVRDWLSAADISLSFIRPVKAAIGRSPLKNAEYLSAGLPVVSTPDIGDDSDFIQGNKLGVVVRNFTTEGYRKANEALERIINAESREQLRSRIRKLAIRHRDINSVEMKVLRNILHKMR